MGLELEIVTPDERLVYKGLESVGLPTVEGEVGILSGHIPLLTKIVAGEIQVMGRDGEEYLAVGGGFARVYGDRVSVLVEAAINVKEVDLAAVEEAERLALEALKAAKADEIGPEEYEKLEASARFAMAQKVVKMRH